MASIKNKLSITKWYFPCMYIGVWLKKNHVFYHVVIILNSFELVTFSQFYVDLPANRSSSTNFLKQLVTLLEFAYPKSPKHLHFNYNFLSYMCFSCSQLQMTIPSHFIFTFLSLDASGHIFLNTSIKINVMKIFCTMHFFVIEPMH